MHFTFCLETCIKLLELCVLLIFLGKRRLLLVVYKRISVLVNISGKYDHLCKIEEIVI